MVPDIFKENFFTPDFSFKDNLFALDSFDSFFKPSLTSGKQLRKPEMPAFWNMKTDIRKTEDGYQLDMELPGIKKEDVKISLTKGHLNVSVENSGETENKDDAGKILRKERYCGIMSRTFYVGDDVAEEDIDAKFDNGILTLSVKKKEAEKPEKKLITIK
jgi:HSP20 family molecular chaperone IbpA